MCVCVLCLHLMEGRKKKKEKRLPKAKLDIEDGGDDGMQYMSIMATLLLESSKVKSCFSKIKKKIPSKAL